MFQELEQKFKMPILVSIQIKFCDECQKETNHIKETRVFPVKKIKYKCCKCKVKDWEETFEELRRT